MIGIYTKNISLSPSHYSLLDRYIFLLNNGLCYTKTNVVLNVASFCRVYI